MISPVYKKIYANKNASQKSIALLIDPDKIDERSLEKLVELADEAKPDYILIGGSLITSANTELTMRFLKRSLTIPLILFPGNALHIHPSADAILFLSLISGRNPEYLIGQHVHAAPILKRTQIEVISTGYMLINCGKPTTANYMSNTFPIPNNKPEIAVSTAMAGEMLGMKMIYLEAGSGADHKVPNEMIIQVREAIDIPLIVGGGIRSVESAEEAYGAGADILVVGTAIEKNPAFISELCKLRDRF